MQISVLVFMYCNPELFRQNEKNVVFPQGHIALKFHYRLSIYKTLTAEKHLGETFKFHGNLGN